MTEITQEITPPGTAPTSTDPDTFDPRADAFLSVLELWGTELNEWADQVNTVAGEVNVNAEDTAADVVLTAADVVSTASNVTAAENASNATAYDTGIIGGYDVGDVVYSTDGASYRCIQAQAEGAVEALSNIAFWTSLASVNEIVRDERTSNTNLISVDNGKLIDISSGTFSQTFDAAATLDSGWYVYIRNSGTGDITLDPDSSELIDGLISYIMYPGETRLIQCTGTAFTSIVLSSFYKIFTSTGSFIKPPGYSVFGTLIWCGGASGEKRDTNVTTFGGSGGGCALFSFSASDFGTTETVTIGAGGISVSSNSTAGNIGGDSSIGSLVTVYAGVDAKTGGSVMEGLTAPANTAATGFEGTVSGGSTVLKCSSTWGGASSPTGDINSGNSIWGGAGGGSIPTGNLVRSGGTSIFGGSAGASSVTGNAVDGTAPAGGGGAARDNTGDSGAGGSGEIRIWGEA